jgi:transcriptional regulator with XRE-family HTH domain
MGMTRTAADGFAENLRKYCQKKASIALVCRETQIHRQQFNKYLSGTSFPNAHNLSKICKYLGVTAEALFVTKPATQMPSAFATKNHAAPLKQDLQFNSENILQRQNFASSDVPQAIREGSYFCYFPYPGHGNLLLRSYIRVWKNDGALVFSRSTRVGRYGDKNSSMTRGRHFGMVVQSSDEVSFVGRNKQAPHQVSLINIDCKTIFDRHHFGIAMTRAAGNSIACRMALEFLGPIHPTRSIVRSLGLVQANDDSVKKEIRQALSEINGSPGQVLFAPSAAEIFSCLVA